MDFLAFILWLAFMGQGQGGAQGGGGGGGPQGGGGGVQPGGGGGPQGGGGGGGGGGGAVQFPPFPGPAWVPDDPPGPGVPDRAWYWNPILWDYPSQTIRQPYAQEVFNGRPMTFQAQWHGSKMGTNAWRLAAGQQGGGQGGGGGVGPQGGGGGGGGGGVQPGGGVDTYQMTVPVASQLTGTDLHNFVAPMIQTLYGGTLVSVNPVGTDSLVMIFTMPAGSPTPDPNKFSDAFGDQGGTIELLPPQSAYKPPPPPPAHPTMSFGPAQRPVASSFGPAVTVTPQRPPMQAPPGPQAWPTAAPAALPPFPGPGWVPDTPPGPGVAAEAQRLNAQLWNFTTKTKTKPYIQEQFGGRWMTFAPFMNGAYMSTAAYRLA